MESGMQSGMQKSNVAFQEFIMRFQEQLDRFDKSNSELSQIGNRLIDDSSDLIKGKDGEKKPGNNGLIRDLGNLLERFNDLNSFYAKQINKLHTII